MAGSAPIEHDPAIDHNRRIENRRLGGSGRYHHGPEVNEMVDVGILSSRGKLDEKCAVGTRNEFGQGCGGVNIIGGVECGARDGSASDGVEGFAIVGNPGPGGVKGERAGGAWIQPGKEPTQVGSFAEGL